MLEDQITQLGTLRNANPRDAGFKLWRQNTLTVLQRIWPGDSTRSERFRRIAFSPSHGKPDGQTLRDWYTRGCTETTAYLHALIDMIDREGVPPAPDVMPEALPSSAGSREDDFPVLDLPAQGGGAGKTLVLGQSDSLADMAAMPGTDSGREAGAPAPPRSWRTRRRCWMRPSAGRVPRSPGCRAARGALPTRSTTTGWAARRCESPCG